jgi:DNA-binding NarL/FixJ family response regulator
VLEVVLIDDSVAIRRSLARLVGSNPGVRVAGTAEDVAGALRLIDRVSPDVVVLDVNPRGDDNGIDVLHHVRQHWPRTQVVVMSMDAYLANRAAFMASGTSAFFDKATQIEQVREWVGARA